MRSCALIACMLMMLSSGWAHAEGFFRAELEAIDLAMWPEVRLVLRVNDESAESNLDDGTALPNVYSDKDCPKGVCWRIVTVEEDSIPVTVIAQQTAPILPRSAAQYLWVHYRSNQPQRGNFELGVALETAYGGNRTAADQPTLYPDDVADNDNIRHSPWPFLQKTWDAELNAHYGALRDAISGAPKTALVQAQRTWIRYRNAFCAGLSEGGSTDARAQCLALRSAQRSAYLRDASHFLDGRRSR